MTTYATSLIGVLLLVLAVLLAAGVLPFTPLVVGGLFVAFSLGLLVPIVTVVRP